MSPENKNEFLAAYDEYADALFRFCYFRTRDRDLAKDLVQETFCRVWAYLRVGRQVSNFRPFLYKTALNLIIDESRKKRAASLEDLAEKGFTPEDGSEKKMEQKLLGGELISLVGSLEEKYRNAVLMRFLEELSPKEIAEALGVSENVVSVRIHRGLKKLRELYGK